MNYENMIWPGQFLVFLMALTGPHEDECSL